MHLRFWIFSLVLCALLVVSHVAQAQSQSENRVTNSEMSPARLPQEVKALCIYTVKDRRILPVSYTAKELTASPAIQVDGYVTGVVVLSAAPVSVTVDDQPMDPIQKNRSGDYQLKYFGDVYPHEFWSTVLPSDEQQSATEDTLQGRYSYFCKVPGSAISDLGEFQIKFLSADAGTAGHLIIRQTASLKLDSDSSDRSAIGAPEFRYLGNQPQESISTQEGFDQRMHAISAGVQAVMAAVNTKLVDHVYIIDLDGQNNAFTCGDRSDIWMYRQVFWNEPLNELSVIAEHESLHILTDRLSLQGNSQIRELYAELMGYGPFSWERFFLVTNGQLPGDATQNDAAKPDLLFSFINEKNFLHGMKGGHSQDNINEFCASFLHTLMYADRLDQKLNEPIVSQENKPILLSSQQREQLLRTYRSALQTFIQALPAQAPEQLSAFFQRSMAVAEQAGGLPAVRADAANSELLTANRTPLRK